mmetsp:Transcript_16521/g.47932  ORF Transcript_16521/g.47932 Transcript_16521/m.47932 type:complete len:384 (-) Transcript_16521:162-1313(-)
MPVQHPEHEAHSGQLLHADVASMSHRQAGDALEYWLMGHCTEGVHQALPHSESLFEPGVVQPLRQKTLSFVRILVERVVQSLTHCRPRMAVVLKHHRQQVLRVLGEVEVLGCSLQPLLQRRPAPSFSPEYCWRNVGEELLPRKHREQDDAATPNITLGPINAVPELGSHVSGSALDLLSSLPLEAAAQTEVDHHEVCEVLLGVHEILRFDVVVPAVLGVAALQRLKHVPKGHGGIVLAHVAALRQVDPIQQVWTLAQLENQVEVLLLVVKLHQLHNVWVVEGKEGGNLVGTELASSAALLQSLDRPRDAQHLVPGLEHLAEAALPDLLPDLVCRVKTVAGDIELGEVAPLRSLANQVIDLHGVRDVVHQRRSACYRSGHRDPA